MSRERTLLELHNERERALDLLAPLHQEHVLDQWDLLTPQEKEHLLAQIASINWNEVQTYYQQLVVRHEVPIQLPNVPWEPATALARHREVAYTAGVQALRHQPEVWYGLFVVAGGTGSGLKFSGPKGMFPASPLAGMTLFQSLVEKSKAAARANGQPHMYPIVIMTSLETDAETRTYFSSHHYFGEPERILIVQQRMLPLLDRRPGHEGRAIMKSRGEIYLGGAGHGDAFDYCLRQDSVATWLSGLGVRYMHFLNVDNVLNPIGDPFFIGEHILSQDTSIKGRAHISLILVPKPKTGRMGNVIQFHENDRLVQKSIDYGLYPEVDRRCDLGHASLQVVSVDSLSGTAPIPFTAAAKEVHVGDSWIPAWKFECSANNKDRYGAILIRDSQAVFASIKRRSEDSDEETPATAARLLSAHWRRILESAWQRQSISFDVDSDAMIELPWDAAFMAPAALVAHLSKIHFPTTLKAGVGYLVEGDFGSFKEIQLPSGSDPTEPGERVPDFGKLWEKRPVDRQRIRALSAAFNNEFAQPPDLLVCAPGRNTAIGDHQDYPPLPQDGSAKSFTIAWASQKNVLVAAKKRADHGIKLFSLNYRQHFTFSLDDLDGLAQEASRGNLPDVYGQELYPWARNILALLYSARYGRRGLRTGLPLQGAEFAFEGNLPMGAGQASSAAFLVAMTLACNELFGWGIDRSDLFTLADLARSGEHEAYSPFVKKGQAGYLDPIASLAGKEGQAILINHGDYREVEYVTLSPIEEMGYIAVILHSGLSRSLAETDYPQRVQELGSLPPLLNRHLGARKGFISKENIHQFSPEEWVMAEPLLAQEEPRLTERARYIFQEKERVRHFVAALKDRDSSALLRSVNDSGRAMSMEGSFQISGMNKNPLTGKPFPGLDSLRDIALRCAGPGAACRMMGGGGAGALLLILAKETFGNKAFRDNVITQWRRLTGLQARFDADSPSAGAEIVWQRSVPEVLKTQGARRLERYRDFEGQDICRLVDASSGVVAEIIPSRGTVNALTMTIHGLPQSVLYDPQMKPAENGAAPYFGPWINRVKDGQANFDGRRLDLRKIQGVRLDDDGHPLHGLMTHGWHTDWAASGPDEKGIRLQIWIETQDYTEDPGARQMFGPARTTVIYRLEDSTLHIESTVEHLKDPLASSEHRIPVMGAVHPWFLLHPQKYAFTEIQIPARRHRITWKKILPHLKMIPLPYLPSMPIRRGSRHFFQEGRRLGVRGYDDTYTHLFAETQSQFPSVTLKDWFRDLFVEVGVVKGYNEFTLYTPGDGSNTVCLEPQIGSINALGSGAPVDSRIPALAPGERFYSHMFIRVDTLSRRGLVNPFAAAHPVPIDHETSMRFPRLLSDGYDSGPLAAPRRTSTHKDAARVFFAGQWHIYGTGHELRDVSNPPPGHRPHRGSILFHLAGPSITGPYIEKNPPLLIENAPKGIYEAPSLVADGDTLHLFVQTTYYQKGGSIEHFVSNDGHRFTWAGTALRSQPAGHQIGIYDADAVLLPTKGGVKPALVYSGFSRPGGRADRPDPVLFVALGSGGWGDPFINGERPILTDGDVPWHNSHDPANPYYEWGLEGAQLLPLKDGRFLMLGVAFEKRPNRAYMPAQRLFFALYDRDLRLLDVSKPILPHKAGWEEYGHGCMVIDDQDPKRLRLLFQARPANEDRTFRDSNTWRLFEAIFDLSSM